MSPELQLELLSFVGGVACAEPDNYTRFDAARLLGVIVEAAKMIEEAAANEGLACPRNPPE